MTLRPLNLRVLLVEDNPGDALLACERLSDAPDSSLTVLQAPTLSEALQRLGEERFDVIVLDLSLPDSMGTPTLLAVRRAAPATPVVVVSGVFDARLRDRVLAEGADEMFGKDETNSRLFVRSVLYVVERHRARLQHEQLQHLLDAMPDAILVADSSGQTRFANPAAEALFGLRRDQLLAEPVVFSAPSDVPTELTIVSGGEPRTCEMRVVDIEWGGEAAQLASIRDLTARHQAEQLRLRSAVLERDNERIASATRAKSRFLANMSHEIRTPMNAVIGLSYLLERTELSVDQADLVGKVKVAGKALLGIINNVLDLSKIEAAELTLEHAPFDVNRLLQDVSLLAGVQAQAKGIDFSIEAPEALEPRVGDATRLQQVLSNLVNNAIKFTERGGVTLEVRERPGPQGVPMLRFGVRDSGIGISPEARQRLFQPFVQADASTTRRFGGTGLGLSIVRQLVELMGGRVGVNSHEGVGSEFWVELALECSDSGAFTMSDFMVPAEPRAQVLPQALPGLRLLVVDDSPINREVARRILELEGATVSQAENGQEAVSRLLADPQGYDLVLMDVQMPVLDGLDATRRIRSGLGLRRLPIIALTAGTLGSERQMAEAAGMNDFVPKPFEPEMLLRRIRRHARASGRDSTNPPPGPARDAPTVAQATTWPAIQGIDGKAARRRLGGDLALFASMLGRLLRDFADLGRAPTQTPEQRRGCAARLHNLKGSAATLGAQEIERLAACAERQAQGGPAEALAETLAVLARRLAELEPAAAALSAQARQAEQERDQPAPAPVQAPALDRLLVLLRSSNIAAEKQFHALAPALRGQLGVAAFEELRARIEDLQYDDAARLLQALAAATPADA
jgi:signal transduction histidine kinase/DNA-binding LytR/AlgR family response regulator